MLRLPGAVRDLFVKWIEDTYPDRARRVINRLTSLRGEGLNDARFGVRMRGEGHWADVINRLYRMTIQRHGLNQARAPLDVSRFKRPPSGQLTLFE